MRDKTRDILAIIYFVALVITASYVFYSIANPIEATGRVQSEILRNRFYDNCGTPNSLEPKQGAFKSRLKHVKWN
jgi:hypothetical protein